MNREHVADIDDQEGGLVDALVRGLTARAELRKRINGAKRGAGIVFMVTRDVNPRFARVEVCNVSSLMLDELRAYAAGWIEAAMVCVGE